MKKAFILLLAILLLLTTLPWLVSCKDNVPSDNDGELPSPGGADAPPADTETDAPYTIGGVDLAAFTIVRDEFADKEVKSLCIDFRNRINEVCGTELELVTDYIDEYQPVSPYEIVLGNTAREGSPVLADSNSVGMYVLDGRLFLRADDAEQLGALLNRFFMEIGEDAYGQAVPFHLEEGYMKEYDSNYALVRVDGAQLKTEEAYTAFQTHLCGGEVTWKTILEERK